MKPLTSVRQLTPTLPSHFPFAKSPARSTFYLDPGFRKRISEHAPLSRRSHGRIRALPEIERMAIHQYQCVTRMPNALLVPLTPRIISQFNVSLGHVRFWVGPGSISLTLCASMWRDCKDGYLLSSLRSRLLSGNDWWFIWGVRFICVRIFFSFEFRDHLPNRGPEKQYIGD